MCSHAIAPHSLEAADKRLELVVHVARDVPDAVIGDPVRLNQVLSNLVSNAVKFTKRGEVLLDVVSASRSPKSTLLHFSVQDTGVGVYPEDRDRIFSPFEQAEGAMTRTHGGAGLGLAICRQIVHLMGGRLWLDTLPGMGSTFHVTLNLRLQSPTSQSTWGAGTPDLVGLKVLIADDNATSRRALEALLVSWGIQPSLRCNGREALDELRIAVREGRPYDVVILDAVMPELGGVEAAESIRLDRDLERTPIIIMGFARRQSDFDLRKKLGLASILPKPVSPPLLLNAISERSQRAFSSRSDPLDQKERAFPVSDRPLRILLVEDQAVNRHLAEMMLRKMGHSVRVALHGRESLSLLREEAFDLILMDVEMPEMDGLEATRNIRELEKAAGSHIPIIAMTAHALPGDRDKYLKSGMDGYLAKPIRATELFAMVDQFSGTTADRLGSPATGTSENHTARAGAWSGPGAGLNTESSKEEMRLRPSNSASSDAGQCGIPANLPGIAVRTALENLRCDEPFFNELLLDFSRDFRYAAETIWSSWEHRDFEQTRRLVHSVKGVSGSLWATDVHEAAKELEQALESGDETDFPLVFGRFESNLSVVLRSIDSLSACSESESGCCEESAHAPRKGTDLDTGAMLRRLSKLLVAHDTESFVLARDLEPLLSCRTHIRHWEDLQTCLQRLDFSGAQNALTRLAQVLDAPLDREHA